MTKKGGPQPPERGPRDRAGLIVWCPDCAILGVQVRHVLRDGLLYFLLGYAAVAEVDTVGQGVAIGAEGNEVLWGVGAAFPARYNVMDLEVAGTIAEGATVSVTAIHGLSGALGYVS